MDLIPHIDIIEPERIKALLAEERNYVWRVVDSETLDSWSPDLGLTAYPRPSILRAGRVARSGMSSTLRHRFWQTIQRQADHTGERYIGVLIHLYAGETCPMEWRLAGADIGRIEPARNDNRLHLIVIDKAVEFIGEMEVLQMTAPGKGSYRIEKFVLLHDRPQPSSFIPMIENLTWRADSHKNIWRLSFHFVTSLVCDIEVAVEQIDEDQERQYQDLKVGKPGRLHHISFGDLPEDGNFIGMIAARDMSGASATQKIEFTTSKPEIPESQETVIPVELINPNRTDLTGLPLQFGIPVAQGRIHQVESCFIETAGDRIPALEEVTSYWPDGSARWLTIHSQAPAALADGEPQGATVHINGDKFAPAYRQRPWPRAGETMLTWWTELRERQADAGKGEDDNRYLYLANEDREIRIKRRTESNSAEAQWISENKGKIQTTVDNPLGLFLESDAPTLMSITDWRFEAVLGNGKALSTDPIVKAQHGSYAAMFTVAHEDEHGVAHLRSTLRLQFYPDQTFVKLRHRLEVISPALSAAAAGGALPDECEEAMRSAIVGDDGEESALLKLRSFSLKVPFAGARVVRHSGKPWLVDDGGWQLRHDHDLAYEVGDESRDGRANGHIIIDGNSGTLGIGLRNFWQRYPKALAVDSDGINIALFPERAGRDLPGDEDAWHRLYFWLDDDGCKLKAGMALSNEILIDFGCENMAVFDWLEQGIVARPDIDYLNSTGALYPIGPRRESLLPDYETLADRALNSFHEDREHFRAYGQVNFGDWYGESGWSWGNNEYDPAYCAYSEFLRGGDPRWAIWGGEAARHLSDVDTVNHSSDKSEIGGQAMHMPGHLGGYLPPLFRSKMAGAKSIPSHTWVEGPLLHDFLTGDPFVRQSVEKTKSWLLQRRFFDYYDFTNAREAGWRLIHLCMLAMAQDDPECLNAAAIIVERVLERAEPDGGWVRMLTDSHCGCGYPRCRGEAGFMVGVLLSGLKRYYNLSGDDAVGEAIVGGARWLIRETFDNESGYFRYTSCVNRSLGGNFQCTQWVLEGLAAAWEISGDAEIGRVLEDGLRAIGLFPEGILHLGMGKAMSQQMRYMPTILAALNKRPLEGVTDD